jgi:hypothetical protein
MPTTTIQFFRVKYDRPELQAVGTLFYDIAHKLEVSLPDSAEKSAGMRKLLEAKDCFVRASLPPFPRNP